MFKGFCRLAQSFSVVMFLFLLTGCGKSPEDEVAERLVKAFDEYCATIDGVTDEPSSKVAAAQITSLIQEFEAVIAESKSLDKEPSRKMAKEIRAAQDRFKDSMQAMGERLAHDPALMNDLVPAWRPR